MAHNNDMVHQRSSITLKGAKPKPPPKEISDFFEGKGIPISIYKKYYGIGSIAIHPTTEDRKARFGQ